MSRPASAVAPGERRPSLAAGLWLALIGTPSLLFAGVLVVPSDSELGTWAIELGPGGAAVVTGLVMLSSWRWRRFGAGLIIGAPLGFVALLVFMLNSSAMS